MRLIKVSRLRMNFDEGYNLTGGTLTSYYKWTTKDADTSNVRIFNINNGEYWQAVMVLTAIKLESSLRLSADNAAMYDGTGVISGGYGPLV